MTRSAWTLRSSGGGGDPSTLPTSVAASRSPNRNPSPRLAHRDGPWGPRQDVAYMVRLTGLSGCQAPTPAARRDVKPGADDGAGGNGKASLTPGLVVANDDGLNEDLILDLIVADRPGDCGVGGHGQATPTGALHERAPGPPS